PEAAAGSAAGSAPDRAAAALLDRAGPTLAVLSDQAGAVARACRDMALRFQRGGTLLVFGTGPSAADALHVAVEFVHPVIVGKRALPALSLCTDAATVTGVAERAGLDHVFAHQLRALGSAGDMALGMATGAPGPAVLEGLAVAREMGMLTTLLSGPLSGPGPGPVAVDHALAVPSEDPHIVKEVQVSVYHVLWELVHVFFERPGSLAS
ncbi:MAG: D-sedoheptulose-7-phosphate isomerase, partial [Acidimicrobiales bacterium]